MWLFFAIVIILSFPESESVQIHWYSYILPILSFGALFYVSVFFYMRYLYRKKDSGNLAVKVENVSDSSYNTLAFIASYFVPLVSFDLNTIRHQIVLVILFIAVGIIYIRYGFYYSNPSLALLGLRVYSATIVFQDGSKQKTTIISRDCLEMNNIITYKEIDGKTVISAKILK